MHGLRSVFVILITRLTLAGGGAAAALTAFLILSHEVHGGETQRFDTAVFQYFQAKQSVNIHLLMTLVSLLASGWAILGVSLACVVAFWRKPACRPDALAMLLAGPGGQGIVSGLKVLFHRTRPEAAFDALGYSFPSGHSFAAVTLYGMLAVWLTRAVPARRAWVWGVTLVLILLIGFSRIYLGVHYASDVAAGYTAGLPWLWGCCALAGYAFRERGQSREPDERKRETQ